MDATHRFRATCVVIHPYYSARPNGVASTRYLHMRNAEDVYGDAFGEHCSSDNSSKGWRCKGRGQPGYIEISKVHGYLRMARLS